MKPNKTQKGSERSTDNVAALKARAAVGTVSAGSHLLVLSESFEAGRLHVVSPAAQPVVAFYMNNTRTIRAVLVFLYIMRQNKVTLL